MKKKKEQLKQQINKDDQELNEAISKLAPIEDQVNEAKSEKSSISSENARKLKKAEGKIRSIRDKQRDFEHTMNQESRVMLPNLPEL